MSSFRSFRNRINIIATVDDLQYGIVYELGSFHVCIRKQQLPWVKRHGPFETKNEAAEKILEIVREYNAITEFKSESRP